MALIEENYFKSKDVRVFPSSFRGTYDNANNTTTFDPEARLNTEANFIVPKTSDNKASYIVNYNTNTIKFVLGGYYFELNNITDYDLKDKYLNIKLRDITIAENQDADNKDSERKTSLLDTWENDTTDHILDSLNSTKTISYFTGLKISESLDENAYASIKLFNTEGKLNQEAVLVDLDHGTGENTLMHGVGLTAATINQTVFGTYNDNKANNLFEVGKGSSETNKHNALEISTTTTTINNATNINGNTIIIGNTKINGTAEITNNTAIKGDLIISKDTESTSTTTGALIVTGGAGIGKNLNVGGDTNLNNKVIIKTTPAENETNVKVDGTLNVTGKTTIYNNVTIDSDKNILAKPVEITNTSDNALVVKGKTTIEKDLEVGNNTKILIVKNSPSTGEQNVTITGTLKSTDKATFENGLEVASGKTTELGGQVNITGAVNINTSNQENPEDITIYGETKITGKVTINGKATSNSTTSTDGSTTLTTKDYVDSKINALDVASVGEDGKYLKTISEVDGQIKATPQEFDKTINSSSTDNNAPTSKAVNSFVLDTAEKLWTSSYIKKSSTSTTCSPLQTIILDAVYPVGSIYTQFIDKDAAAPSECPIKASLGGKWELIDAGKFLRAVGEEKDTRGQTGGSADAVVISHTHTGTVENRETGLSVNTLTGAYGAFNIRSMQSGDSKTIPTVGAENSTIKDVVKDMGYRQTNHASIDYRGKGDTQLIRINLDHGHTITDEGHTHEITINPRGEDGTDKNLPPYLNVYMWKRTG